MDLQIESVHSSYEAECQTKDGPSVVHFAPEGTSKKHNRSFLVLRNLGVEQYM